MFALRTIEQGWGVRARWQNFRTRIPRLWVQYQFLWFTNWLWWKKNRFSPLLAPLCPCETLSPVGSRGAKFECPLWWAGFDAGCSELGSIPVSCKKIIVFDEKNLLLQSPLCPRGTESPGRLSSDWFQIFLLQWAGFDSSYSERFFLFPVRKKESFCPFFLFVRSKRQVLLGSFRTVGGSNAGADKTFYQ